VPRIWAYSCLEREKRVFTGETEKDELPNLEGHEYILERYLKPELPKALLDNLKADDIVPTSMCFLTSGLADGTLRIAKSSGTGAKLFADKIPIAKATYDFAETDNNLSPLVAALNGGDDFQMLFTLPLDIYENRIQRILLGHHRPYVRRGFGVYFGLLRTAVSLAPGKPGDGKRLISFKTPRQEALRRPRPLENSL